MTLQKHTCTISGLRPHKLPCDLDLPTLLGKIEDEIRKSVALGYTVFQVGMARGVDIWAAKIVLKIKREFPAVKLKCYRPCDTQADNWDEEWREEYFNILAVADDVICMQRKYSDGCMRRRNERMIDYSSRLIAVYDGKSIGGTRQIIEYGRGWGLDIVIINPLDCVKETGNE